MKPLRAAAVAAVAIVLSAWRLHPIHAARVELDVTSGGAVSATVHVYRDDLPATLTLSDLATYFDRVLVITDAHGTRVPLRPTAMVPEGDRLRIAMVGPTSSTIGGGHIALTLLQDHFADQVNVVDARIQGRRAQLVFLRGDGPQALP